MLNNLTCEQLDDILSSPINKHNLLKTVENLPIKEALTRSDGYLMDAIEHPSYRWNDQPWLVVMNIAFQYRCTAEYYFGDILNDDNVSVLVLLNTYIAKFGKTEFIEMEAGNVLEGEITEAVRAAINNILFRS
jgi:hypothetical protein